MQLYHGTDQSNRSAEAVYAEDVILRTGILVNRWFIDNEFL